MQTHTNTREISQKYAAQRLTGTVPSCNHKHAIANGVHALLLVSLA